MKWWHILLDVVAAFWVVVCAYLGFLAFALSASWNMSGPVSLLAAFVLMSPSLWWFVHSYRKHDVSKTRVVIVVAILVVFGFLIFNSN